jgi:TRAP transporter TAXI family solute receptor
MKLLKGVLVSVASGALFATIVASANQNLSIGTGATGGVYYVIGGGLAKVLTEKLPGTQVTAEVTGASVDNLKFIKSGKMDIGFTMADSASDALQGIEKFKDGKVEARTLVALYPNHMQVITVEGTGINKLADLKGKRISTGSPGSGTEVMALRMLEALGIDKDKDVSRERLSVNESVNAMKDKKIDAFVWVSGLPAGAVTDLASTPGVKIKLLDHADAADAMNKKYGRLYTKGTIPANSYPGQDKAAQNIQVWNLLVVDAKMSDDLAYKITKTVFDEQPDLVRVHKDASHISLKAQGSTSPIPYHPGAKKYLKEKGVSVQ